MLVLLWLLLLCFTVGARSERGVPKDDIRRILDRLEIVVKPTDDSYSRNPDKVTSKGYPRQPTTPGPDHLPPSSTASYPGGQRTSSTKHPDGYGSSTTERTPVDHSEVPQNGYEDGHSDHPSVNEQEHPLQVGSVRGIPGITFPDYIDIPLTHFRCSDKVYVPGFYADMETGCQVFHVCWPHRRESFLCPVGTIFNQAILACDYWYSSNCSLASHYYDVNAVSPHTDKEYKEKASLGSMVNTLLEAKGESALTSSEASSGSVSKESLDLSEIVKFLPVKAKVTVYPETAKSPLKIVAKASVGKTRKSNVVEPDHHKDQIDELKAEYDQIRPKIATVTRRPHEKVVPVHKVVEQKTKTPHGEIDPSVHRIINEVFAIAKKIVMEAGGFIPKLGKDLRGGKRRHEGKNPLPLTKLNQRFITKPVRVSK